MHIKQTYISAVQPNLLKENVTFTRRMIDRMMHENTTHGILHEGFRGFRRLVARKKQINNSKEIALFQIESVRKSVQIDFNKTVLSGSRQSWINELRVLISKILSKTMTISAKQNMSN